MFHLLPKPKATASYISNLPVFTTMSQRMFASSNNLLFTKRCAAFMVMVGIAAICAEDRRTIDPSVQLELQDEAPAVDLIRTLGLVSANVESIMGARLPSRVMLHNEWHGCFRCHQPPQRQRRSTSQRFLLHHLSGRDARLPNRLLLRTSSAYTLSSEPVLSWTTSIMTCNKVQ